MKSKFVKCKYCEKEFKTNVENKKFCSRICYLNSVSAKITKICDECGQEFTVYKSELKRKYNRGKFCSMKCYNNNIIKTKSRQNRVILICKQCGKSYEVYKHKELTSHYCSYECRNMWRHENLIGKNHWQYKDKIPIKCEICGDIFYVNEYKVKHQNPKYCSYECHGKSKVITGSRYGSYCEKFNNDFKKRVKAFFGNKCIVCGKHTDNGKGLHVHHIHYDKKSCCNDESKRKFALLCSSCHAKTTFGDREYWKLELEKLIDTKFGGKSYFTQDEYRMYMNALGLIYKNINRIGKRK